MTRINRDELYLQLAELIAKRATCPRRQVGCVVVDVDGRILATGYNGVPSGTPHCNEGFPCPGSDLPSGQGLDKCVAIHAEQNAVLLLPDPRKAHTIYVSTTPCVSCMKLLLGTSAERIVARTLYPHEGALEWWAKVGRELVILRSGFTEEVKP